MRIAVIIPAYNVASWLAECLVSLRRQTHADWSAVVVDDGSSDATAAIAETFGDSRISVVRQSNAGVSAARNRGMATVCDALAAWSEARPAIAHATRNSTADAVLFLDADDWLAVDALARLAKLLDASPWAVAACGGYARVGADGSARPVRPPPGGALLPRLLARNLFANGGHMLIRREAVEEAGAFRPELTYGEDWEYWTRLALLGEFVSLRSREPVLFLRERQGSLYRTMAADPACYQPSLEAVFSNPAIRSRLGAAFARDLRAAADAEIAWAVGRELIRHGRLREGRQWLGRSFRAMPRVTRLVLMGLSWLRAGPFRRYGQSAQS